MNDRIKYKLLSLTYKSQYWSTKYLCSFFSFPSHRCTRSLLLSPSVALLSPLVLKLQIDLTILLLFVEQSPISSMSRCSSHHYFTDIKLASLWSFKISFSFWKQIFKFFLKTHLFHCFFLLRLYSPTLSQETYILVLTTVNCFISYSFRYHSPSFHSYQFLFYLTCLWISGH